MKLLLADAFTEKYATYTTTRSEVGGCHGCCAGVVTAGRYSEVMITKNAFEQMLTDADLMVDRNPEVAREYGVLKSTEISLITKAGRHLHVMRTEIMKHFAEDSGIALVNG